MSATRGHLARSPDDREDSSSIVREERGVEAAPLLIDAIFVSEGGDRHEGDSCQQCDAT